MSDLIQARDYWVDSELNNKLPKLSIQSYHELEKLILKDGLQEEIKYYVLDGKKIIVDGHNRLDICTKHNIPIRSKEMKFENREDILDWMMNNQIGRRNCSTYLKIEYALANEKELIKLAPKEIKQSNKKLAYVLKVSEVYIKYVRKMLKNKAVWYTGIPHLVIALNEGTISIKEAYKEIFKKEKEDSKQIEVKEEKLVIPIQIEKSNIIDIKIEEKKEYPKTIEEALKKNITRMNIETLGIKRFKDESISLIETYDLSKTIKLYRYNDVYLLQQNDLKVLIDLPTLKNYQDTLIKSKIFDSIKHESIILSSGLISSIIQDIQDNLDQK